MFCAISPSIFIRNVIGFCAKRSVGDADRNRNRADRRSSERISGRTGRAGTAGGRRTGAPEGPPGAPICRRGGVRRRRWGKPKASLPDDQVGQLATELANARTRFDVQQVSGKAMRALANLRMAAALCEGRDKARANRMIARMEKLMKRTRVKIRHLDKEEQLERQKRRAEKEQEQKKAGSLRDELNSRRKKRRREEANYAMKEAARDREAAGSGGFLKIRRHRPLRRCRLRTVLHRRRPAWRRPRRKAGRWMYLYEKGGVVLRRDPIKFLRLFFMIFRASA